MREGERGREGERERECDVLILVFSLISFTQKKSNVCFLISSLVSSSVPPILLPLLPRHFKQFVSCNILMHECTCRWTFCGFRGIEKQEHFGVNMSNVWGVTGSAAGLKNFNKCYKN